MLCTDADLAAHDRRAAALYFELRNSLPPDLRSQPLNRKSASSMTARTVPPADACQIFTMFGFANSPSSTPVEIDFPSKSPIILVVGSDVFRSVRGGQSSAERKPDDECLMFRSTRCRHELL